MEPEPENPQESTPPEPPVTAVPTTETTPVWARTVPVAPPLSDNGAQSINDTASEGEDAQGEAAGGKGDVSKGRGPVTDEDILAATMIELERLFPNEIKGDLSSGAQIRKYKIIKTPRSVYKAVAGLEPYK